MGTVLISYVYRNPGGNTNVTAFATNYGELWVTGDDYWDTVCVQNQRDNCVEQFRFLSVLDKDPNLR